MLNNGMPPRVAGNRLSSLLSCSRFFRYHLNRIIDHIAFRVFTLIMILLDVIVVIVDLATNDTNRGLEATSLAIMTYFMAEILLRLFAKG